MQIPNWHSPYLLNNLLKAHLYQMYLQPLRLSVNLTKLIKPQETKVKTFNGFILFDKILSYLNQTWFDYDAIEAQH